MITLFHDVTSPASAVAVARADRLAAEGVAIECVGFEAIGVDVAVPVTLDVLGELDVVAPAAAAESLVLRRPALLPPTGLVHVVGGRLGGTDGDRAIAGPTAAELADDPAAAAISWRRVTYQAFWSRGADLSDPGVLASLAAEVGLDGQAVEALLADRVALAAARRRTGELRREGVGGVPTLLAQRTLVPGLLDDETIRSLAEL